MTMPPEKVTVLVITAVIAVLVSVTVLKSPERVDRDRETVWEEDSFEELYDPPAQADVASLRRGEHRTRIVAPPPPAARPEAGPVRDRAAVPLFETHTVLRGETLGSIARRYYGKSSMWRVVAKANYGVNPKRLKPGQRLKIPSAQGRRRVGGEPAPRPVAASDGGRWHTVARGESLETIARRRLGRGSAWRRIYDANRTRISSPDAIRIGQRLRIPVAH